MVGGLLTLISQRGRERGRERGGEENARKDVVEDALYIPAEPYTSGPVYLRYLYNSSFNFEFQ